jgi:hypothetical protein
LAGIVHGLELLKKGVIWRVYTGGNVNIWRDNWIPSDSGLKIMGKRNRTRLKWIFNLMLPEPRKRNEHLIRNIFYPNDAEVVLQIRIHSFSDEDFVAWHGEKLGCFSVRSAYRPASQQKTSL